MATNARDFCFCFGLFHILGKFCLLLFFFLRIGQCFYPVQMVCYGTIQSQRYCTSICSKDELGLKQSLLCKPVLQLSSLMLLSKLFPLRWISLISPAHTCWSSQTTLCPAWKHPTLIYCCFFALTHVFPLICLVLHFPLCASPPAFSTSEPRRILFILSETLFPSSCVAPPQTCLWYLWLQVTSTH